MGSLIPTASLVKEIELSELSYMEDRMIAIQNRIGNPEGIQIKRFGNAFYIVRQCPGVLFLSQSHRNMERIGMKIGYIRTTWTEG